MSILMMISHAKILLKGSAQQIKPHMCVWAELIEIDDNRIFSSLSLHSIQSIQSDLIIALIQQQQFLIYENHVETAVVVLRLLALLMYFKFYLQLAWERVEIYKSH